MFVIRGTPKNHFAGGCGGPSLECTSSKIVTYEVYKLFDSSKQKAYDSICSFEPLNNLTSSIRSVSIAAARYINKWLSNT